MVLADHRNHFRREVYVGIKDTEQNIEFLGRIVQGPFHTSHEAGADSRYYKKRPCLIMRLANIDHRTMCMEI